MKKMMACCLLGILLSLGAAAPTTTIDSATDEAGVSAPSLDLQDLGTTPIDLCGLGDTQTSSSGNQTPTQNIAICANACRDHVTARGYARCFQNCLEDLEGL